MFCHKCGTKNRDEALFCKGCGTNLKARVLENNHRNLEDVVQHKSPEVSTFKQNFFKKKSLKYTFGILFFAVILFVSALPMVKAYYGYYRGMNLAAQAFSKKDYSKAVGLLQSVDRKGLHKSFANNLNQTLDKYTEVQKDDDSFQQAKKDEANGDLNNSKILLQAIVTDTNYPDSAEVSSELNNVNEAINVKVQADAAAQVAAAKKQSDEAAAQVKAAAVSKAKAQAAAAQAAASAASNEAAAQQAQQEAERQKQDAQAAQAQAAAAEQSAQEAEAAAQKQAQNQADETYLNALVSGTQLLNRVNNEINDAITAYIDGNYTLALTDLSQAENDSYNAEHNLPFTYPAKFTTVNSDLINSANSFNLSAQTFFTAMEYSDSSMDSSAFSSQTSGIYYYNQIKPDLIAVGV